MGIAHWDEVGGGLIEIGHISADWQNLGGAAGSATVGVRRIRVTPERFATPAHSHGADEEIFFVLGGEGLLWQGGSTYAVGADDAMVHRPLKEPHTLRSGGDGLDVLVFGQRLEPALTHLPRAGVAWAWPNWIEVPAGDHPFAREAAAGPPDCPPPSPERPRNVVALEQVPAEHGGASRPLGATAGSRATGLNHVTLGPGTSGAPAHCHSLEEEIFVVLGGTGMLLLQRGREPAEEHELSRGSVVARPAGTGVAHSFRAGEEGLTYLAYGTREPNDMCFYPDSGHVSLRGLGVTLHAGD